MNKEDALGLIQELNGDEHNWVDYKEDYFIKGNPQVETEFIRDIASFANSISDREEYYIFIGCDQENGVAGICDDAKDENREPRHILSFEEDDLQEIVDGKPNPGPRLSLHTFEENGAVFAVLKIKPLSHPPCLTTSQLQDSDDIVMRENEIWYRKASGKKEVNHQDLNEIIQFRINQ